MYCNTSKKCLYLPKKYVFIYILFIYLFILDYYKMSYTCAFTQGPLTDTFQKKKIVNYSNSSLIENRVAIFFFIFNIYILSFRICLHSLLTPSEWGRTPPSLCLVPLEVSSHKSEYFSLICHHVLTQSQDLSLWSCKDFFLLYKSVTRRFISLCTNEMKLQSLNPKK